MTQQYQTKTQQITMFLVLLALVIVVAQKVSAGTCMTNKNKTTQCEENAIAPIEDISIAVSDMPWSPFIAFLTR